MTTFLQGQNLNFTFLFQMIVFWNPYYSSHYLTQITNHHFKLMSASKTYRCSSFVGLQLNYQMYSMKRIQRKSWYMDILYLQVNHLYLWHALGKLQNQRIFYIHFPRKITDISCHCLTMKKKSMC